MTSTYLNDVNDTLEALYGERFDFYRLPNKRSTRNTRATRRPFVLDEGQQRSLSAVCGEPVTDFDEVPPTSRRRTRRVAPLLDQNSVDGFNSVLALFDEEIDAHCFN